MATFTTEPKEERWNISPGQAMLYVVCSMVLVERMSSNRSFSLVFNHNWYWNLHPFIVENTGQLFGCKVSASKKLNATPVVMVYE